MKDQLNEGQFKKPANIRVHLMVSLMGYAVMGFAVGLEFYGTAAGVDLWTKVIMWTCCFVFFAATIAFSLQKVKDYISENDKKAVSTTNP